jgi:predicted HAD superfamily Cof-like phosphohydrolase
MAAQFFMSLESFSRLSQAIKEATESADPEAAKARAAVAVNSIGSMVTAKSGARKTQFSEAVDTLGNALQAARVAKQTERKDTEQPEAAKSLAELLAESAQEAE